MAIYYPNQCWNSVNWSTENKFQLNFNQEQWFSFKKMCLKMLCAKCHSFCLCLNVLTHQVPFNTLRPKQHGCHFPEDIFKHIFLNDNIWILIKISLKFIPKGPINNIPALVQIMAWHRPDDKPLSEPMMARLPSHICVTQLQWLNKEDKHIF